MLLVCDREIAELHADRWRLSADNACLAGKNKVLRESESQLLATLVGKRAADASLLIRFNCCTDCDFSFAEAEDWNRQKDQEIAEKGRELELKDAELKRKAQELEDAELKRKAQESELLAARQSASTAEAARAAAEREKDGVVLGVKAVCDVIGVDEDVDPVNRALLIPNTARENARSVVHKAVSVIVAHYPNLDAETVGQGWPRVDEVELDSIVDDAEIGARKLADNLFDLAVEELDVFPAPNEDPAGDPPADE